MRSLVFIFLFFNLNIILGQVLYNAPYIFPSTVLPVSIYSTSPVRLITKVSTSSWAFRVNTSFTVNAAAYSIYLTNCNGYQGNAISPTPRIFIDTFKVGTLNPGIYTVYLKSNISKGTASCNIDTFSTANFTFQVLEGIDPVDVGIYESTVDPLNFTFLPNPVLDELEINFNQQEQHPIHLQLFDLFGQLVYEERFTINNNKKKIDLRFLKSGIYSLKLHHNYSEKVIKLLKE